MTPDDGIHSRAHVVHRDIPVIPVPQKECEITTVECENEEREYPEGGYGWMAVSGCFIVTFFVRGTAASMGVLFIAYVEYYQTGAGVTSWIPAIYGALGCALAPVAAAFAKRYGHRKVTIIGAILAFVSLMLGSFANNIMQLALTVGLLHGIAAGLSFSPSTSYLGYYFKKRHSLASGIGYSGIGVGSIVLPVLFQACLDMYGLRGTLWIYAALSANLCISSVILRPVKHIENKPPVSVNSVHPGEPLNQAGYSKTSECHVSDELTETEEVNETHTKRRWYQSLGKTIWDRCTKLNELFDCSRLLSILMFDMFLFAYFFIAIGLSISSIHLAPLIKEAGISKENTALLVSIYGVGNVVSGPFCGILATYLNLNIIVFVGCSYIFYGVLALLMPFAHSFSTAAVLVVMLGFGRGGFAPQNSVCIRRIVGESMFVTGYGWALLFAGMGQLIGPLISGYLRDFSGSYNYSFHMGGLVMILTGVVVVISAVVDQGRGKVIPSTLTEVEYERVVVNETVTTV